MDFLKNHINKLKQTTTSATATTTSATNNWVKRGDLEKKREQRYLEE